MFTSYQYFWKQKSINYFRSRHGSQFIHIKRRVRYGNYRPRRKMVVFSSLYVYGLLFGRIRSSTVDFNAGNMSEKSKPLTTIRYSVNLSASYLHKYFDKPYTSFVGIYRIKTIRDLNRIVLYIVFDILFSVEIVDVWRYGEPIRFVKFNH